MKRVVVAHFRRICARTSTGAGIQATGLNTGRCVGENGGVRVGALLTHADLVPEGACPDDLQK